MTWLYFILLLNLAAWTGHASLLRESNTNLGSNFLKSSPTDRGSLDSYAQIKNRLGLPGESNYPALELWSSTMLVDRLRKSVKHLAPSLQPLTQWSTDRPNYKSWDSATPLHAQHDRQIRAIWDPPPQQQPAVLAFDPERRSLDQVESKSVILLNLCSHQIRSSNNTQQILQATRMCTNSLWKLSYDMISDLILTKFQNALRYLMKGMTGQQQQQRQQQLPELEQEQQSTFQAPVTDPGWVRQLESELNAYRNLIMANIQEPESAVRKQVLQTVFDELDYDHDGRFTIEELDLFLRFHEIYP